MKPYQVLKQILWDYRRGKVNPESGIYGIIADLAGGRLSDLYKPTYKAWNLAAGGPERDPKSHLRYLTPENLHILKKAIQIAKTRERCNDKSKVLQASPVVHPPKGALDK